MLDTMSNNITRAIGRLGSVLGAAGGGDDDGGDDDGDDDADGDRGAYARDRRKRGKPNRREDDDESSEGGHPFRRPESIDYYTSRRSGTDQEDDILNFASKGRLRRHMDARQIVTESSQAQVQQGFSNMADMIAASNREYLTIDKYLEVIHLIFRTCTCFWFYGKRTLGRNPMGSYLWGGLYHLNTWLFWRPRSRSNETEYSNIIGSVYPTTKDGSTVMVNKL